MEGSVECSAVVWLDKQMTAVFESIDGLASWTYVRIFDEVHHADLPALQEVYDRKIGTTVYITMNEEALLTAC